MLDWAFTGIGLILLMFAGDALVRGAVNLSLRLGIPALIVSLTVVALGTSAPELLISVKAILGGVPGIALGNVVGSNTANVLLVLGLPALLATMHTSSCDTRAEYLQMLAATALFIGLCFAGTLTWMSGAVLLLALVAMLAFAFLKMRRYQVATPATLEGADPSMRGQKIAQLLAIGMIGLPIGANLLVDGSVNIARTYGVSETVIGLTLVAVGTSLPELATTIVAALRRQAEVALGNVIGSNMFNILGIIGFASLIGPIPVESGFLDFDLWIMAGASVLLTLFVFFRRDITRAWGIVLTGLYIGYLVLVLG